MTQCPRCGGQLHTHSLQECQDGIITKEKYSIRCEHGHTYPEETK